MIIDERKERAMEQEKRRLETKNRIKSLKEKGLSNLEIAQIEGISEAVVWGYLNGYIK